MDFCRAKWKRFGDTMVQDGTVVVVSSGPQQTITTTTTLHKRPLGMSWTQTRNWTAKREDFSSRNSFVQQIFSRHLLCAVFCVNTGQVEMAKPLLLKEQCSLTPKPLYSGSLHLLLSCTSSPGQILLIVKMLLCIASSRGSPDPHLDTSL